jgi:hypothetical protein
MVLIHSPWIKIKLFVEPTQFSLVDQPFSDWSKMTKVQDHEEVQLRVDIDHLDITTPDEDWDLLNDNVTIGIESDKMIREALNKGVDIRQHTKSLEDELYTVEVDSIQEYLSQGENFANLYFAVKKCDSVLAQIETMLDSFQEGLGDVSETVKVLEDQSFMMNVQLKNRKSINMSLGSLIQELEISPQLLKRVTLDVDEKYLENLIEIDKKIDFVTSFKSESLALNQMKPVLEKLKSISVGKVKNFLMSKFNELKKSKVNIAQVKQDIMMYKYYLQYLQKHSTNDAYKEIRSNYSDLMAKIYTFNFSNFVTEMSKCELKIALVPELLVEPPQSYSLFGSNKPVQKQSSLVAGDRGKPLDDLKSQPIKEMKSQYTFEIIFKSLNIKLIDIATSEYIFLRDFFEESSLLLEIFSKTFTLLTNFWKSYLATSFDVVGIFIMLRLSKMFNHLMVKKKMYHFDEYLTQVQIICYHRFKSLIDMNIKSVKDVVIVNIIASEENSHSVAKRYGLLASSLNSLNRDDDLKKPIVELLETLRMAVVKLLQDISEKLKDGKKRLVWLINGYDLIITKFMQYNVECADGFHFRTLLEVVVDKYVDELLNEYYPKLILFVKEKEGGLSDKNSKIQNQSKLDVTALEEHVKMFEKTWKQSIKAIHGDLTKSFRNFNTGMYIFNQCVTKLNDYNTRMTHMVAMCFQDPPFRSSIVTTQNIARELKIYLSSK